MTAETVPSNPSAIRPAGRVLKAAQVRAWMDGFAFAEAQKAAMEEQHRTARKAYSDSYAQGYDDGRAEGATEAARLLHETTVKVDRYLATLEHELIDLSVDIVARVLGAFDTGDLVAHAARQAIADLRRAKYVKVSVNPQVVEAVRGQIAQLCADDGHELPIEIREDSDLVHDACIVSSDNVVIDASVHVQLEAIRRSLRKADEGAA